MTLLSFALVLAYLISGTSAAADPCLSDYKTINQVRRSTGYVLADGETPLSDSHLQNGWYRFINGAGGKMSEHCPQRFHCGTINPGWMNGSHPQKDENQVRRMVCFNYHGNDPTKHCCEHRIYALVKNCGDFFLYYLQTLPYARMAYCAGDKMPCKEGKGSYNGFEPCEDVYPLMDEGDEPVLEAPEVQEHAFRFKCQIDFSGQDPDLMFEVEWTFDGKPDPQIPKKVLTNDNRETYLYGTSLAGHMGQDVEPDKVEVSENGGNVIVTLTSTVPIVCDSNKSCCLSFTLDADGPKNNMVVSNPCQHTLCSTDWDPSTHTAHTDISVMAAKDNIRDRDNHMLLSFQPLFPGSGGPFLNIFNNYTMPTAQCSSRSCHDVTSSLPSLLQGPGMGFQRRADTYADVDEPDPPLDFTPVAPSAWTFTWPTTSGITEHQARHKCTQAIQNSQLYSHCNSSHSMIDEIVHQCMTDVLFGDNFDMLDSPVLAFTASCQFELMQDPDNYNTDANGNLVLKDSIANICSHTCLMHGSCVNGDCVCRSGYTGEQCQLQENTPPTLLKVRGSQFCDLNKRPCRTVYLDADHFEMSSNFKCKVETLLPNGQTAHVMEEKAQFISGVRLACDLPDSSMHVRTDFSVSVTMNGRHYSAALPVTAFDSSCMTCDTSGCQQIAATCIIDDRCYQNNDLKPGDASRMCNTSASSSHWTTVPTAPFPPLTNPTTSGPDLDLMVTCNIHSTSRHQLGVRFEVTWYVDNDVEVGKETLTADVRQATKSITTLPPSSEKVYCKVRSYFEGSSVYSPYMASSSLSLLTVTGTRRS